MTCECQSEQETAGEFMAKQASKKTVKETSVIDHLTAALSLLDKEQSIAENEALFANYRQSREKLKAVIKFVAARLY